MKLATKILVARTCAKTCYYSKILATSIIRQYSNLSNVLYYYQVSILYIEKELETIIYIMQQYLEQFFESNNVGVDSEFVYRFIHNIIFEEVSVSSEWLYAWYKSAGYKSKYHDFCKKIITYLPETEIKQHISDLSCYINTHGGNNKIVYSVTYLGVSLIMMQLDYYVRIYYAKCEQIVKQFFKAQYQKLDYTTQLLEKCRRKCVIYRVDIYDYDSEYVEKQYIGSSDCFDRRKKQHLKSSHNPIIKQYIEAGRKCEIVKVHSFEYHYKEQRAIVEYQYINQLDPAKKMNITNAVSQPEPEEEKGIPKCSNCNRILSDEEQTHKTCQKCLDYSKQSKITRKDIPRPDDYLMCPRCSCVRKSNDFFKDGKYLKTCVNCRDRNNKTSQSIKEWNDANPDQKKCVLCHNFNSNQKAQCDTCLQKKNTN